MALFLSTFINKVDQKGRISVPAPYRAALKGQSFKGVVAFRSYRAAVIEACAMDRMEQLSQSVDLLEQFSEEQDDLASTIFADSHQIPIDGDGRIVLPPQLIEHAGIKNQAAFVGRGATFQIWEPKAFEDHQNEARVRARERRATLALAPRDTSRDTSRDKDR
ncbi:MAG: division/cell wall cluster transcriptional repressor MraZ [Rhodospirillales bacterium]|jgi:MraZ protein|nr:division/cell wall cluster transcriptional repressor MraZ [Rhodospirillales bacterium]MBT4006229.1 division/cell wall cluster transcriptional repressor MraZ [Rhodospirillales bacterium]MBT5076604.1 division/cell wall cluster transcriptional repressor MraZ [Rhodospirillales bacterium]MBT5113173.1 division/cell wall cluster transcriptional repressor MraZ [Rhodospirillales bacterium]MBT5673049.1 division/cell wall cluster transcriptional repressor MraZ [Rhodospirillales bacterium]